MEENMFGKSREEIKAVHVKIREYNKAAQQGLKTPSGKWYSHREVLLLWAFVRGFKYRRVERKRHTQIIATGVYEHNAPSSYSMTRLAQELDLPIAAPELENWFADPSGAIAPPPPRVKKPYIRPEHVMVPVGDSVTAAEE